MQVAAVILAAGASTRFGSQKQLVRIGGRTMLENVVDRAREVGLERVIAVVPPGLAIPDGVVRVVNDEPEAGLSRSLRLGLAAVPPDADAALILLGDEPLLEAEALLEALLLAEEGAEIVATRAGDRLGPPVVLARTRFDLADAAREDHGLGPLLRGQPGLRIVELDRAPRDIDTPADLAAATEVCPGCGERFAPMPDGPTHAYIGASPACWAAYSEVLAREFNDPAYFAPHRFTVDAYAAQHPGEDDRRQRQSVAVHLVGICHWLEHGMSTEEVISATQRILSVPRDWPWMEPPTAYSMTVLDVLAATSAAEHLELVRAWAASVWESWSAHHDAIRAWASEALR